MDTPILCSHRFICSYVESKFIAFHMHVPNMIASIEIFIFLRCNFSWKLFDFFTADGISGWVSSLQAWETGSRY